MMTWRTVHPVHLVLTVGGRQFADSECRAARIGSGQTDVSCSVVSWPPSTLSWHSDGLTPNREFCDDEQNGTVLCLLEGIVSRVGVTLRCRLQYVDSLQETRSASVCVITSGGQQAAGYAARDCCFRGSRFLKEYLGSCRIRDT